MDVEHQISPNVGPPTSTPPLRSPQRLNYEAEIRVFTSRYGSLENVREKLGLSRRKMCQLLLVDPSAWTRWHSPGGRPPPHVYRMVEWYLALEGKAELHPHLTNLYVKGARAIADPGRISTDEVNELCRQVRLLKRLVWVGPAVSALLLLAWMYR